MIIYFSGTGNSRYVAEGLQERIDAGELYELTGDRLLNPQKQLLRAADEELILWVFPTYSWSVPPVVLRFIDKVRFKGAEHARHYMVCTCGDDMGRADDRWRHHIGRRGWTPRGAFSVIAPNNYLCMKGFDLDSPQVEQQKIEAIPARLDEIVAKINRKFSDGDLTRGSIPWLKTNVAYYWFMANKMSPLPFHADPERCTSCGLCARSCPLENITMQPASNPSMQKAPGEHGVEKSIQTLPAWGPVCTMCLRCYHRCPSRAIDYGNFTLGKGQYKRFK